MSKVLLVTDIKKVLINLLKMFLIKCKKEKKSGRKKFESPRIISIFYNNDTTFKKEKSIEILKVLGLINDLHE